MRPVSSGRNPRYPGRGTRLYGGGGARRAPPQHHAGKPRQLLARPVRRHGPARDLPHPVPRRRGRARLAIPNARHRDRAGGDRLFSASTASALYDGQAILVGKTLDRAPAHLRARYLPPVVRGELVGAFATSEPDASTDLSPGMMRTTATEVPGGWRINGASAGSPTPSQPTSPWCCAGPGMRKPSC